jgi:hypothetical protein
MLETFKTRSAFDTAPTGPDGFMPFVLHDFYGRIYGGPFRNRTTDFYGVKMAVEIDMPHDVSVPTADFQTPNPSQLEAGLISAGIAAIQGRDIYVGCMGGIGRTGLFMAVFAKVCGHPDPIGHVRATYKRSAVETDKQRKFVEDFDVIPVQAALLGYLAAHNKRQRWSEARWRNVLKALGKILKAA